MSTQEQRKAWRGVGQKWVDGGFLSVAELNTLTHGIVELVDEVGHREKALREVRERLRGIAGYWHTDDNKLIQIGILIDVELGEP